MREYLFDHRKKALWKNGLLKSRGIEETWLYAQNTFSFYKWYASEYGITKNASANDFSHAPPVTREMITDWLPSIAKELNGNVHFTKTGGTSGRVMNFPVCKSQSMLNFVRVWQMRKSMEIKISSPLIRFWGRSALFSGNREKIKSQSHDLLRRIAFNEKKISSYNLDNHNISHLVKCIDKTNEATIILYGSHLKLIEAYIKQSGNTYNWCGKTFIYTSDSCSVDIPTFNSLTNAKTVGEYGAAETGVIAYTTKSSPNLYSERIKNQLFPFKDQRLFRTQVFGFPLLNYDLDDELKFNNGCSDGVFSIEGKTRPVFILNSSGKQQAISSVAFDHLLKNQNLNHDWQYFYDERNSKLTIAFHGTSKAIDDNLRNDIVNLVRKKFNCIVNVTFQNNPFITQAGKLPRYVIFNDSQ